MDLSFSMRSEFLEQVLWTKRKCGQRVWLLDISEVMQLLVERTACKDIKYYHGELVAEAGGRERSLSLLGPRNGEIRLLGWII